MALQYVTDKQNTVEVGVEVMLVKDGDYIVATCPALELSSFGKTEDEAKEAFHEALSVFMEDLIERQTLERALLDLGWTLRKRPTVEYRPPAQPLRTQQAQPALQPFSETFSVPV